MRNRKSQAQMMTRREAMGTSLGALAGAGVLSGPLFSASRGRAQDAVIKSHGYSYFGDLKYPADFKHLTYVNPNAPKGGEFSTWAFGTFDSLNPFVLKGEAAQGSTIFYDTLMTGNLDEPDSLYGLLAHTIEYPENAEWVIFHLCEEARFSDGSPVTAADVKFSFEILRDKGQPSYKLIFADVDRSEVIDPLTIRFVFKPTGSPRDRIQTVAGLPVLSKAYFDTHDFEEPTLKAPVGSGPYTLEEVEPGRMVAYRRREDYWAKDLPINVGQNNFDVLKFEYFADYTIAFEAFKGGAYLFREEFLSKLWATGYNFPAIQRGDVAVESLPDGRPAGTQGFFINLRRKKFADPGLRQAIGLAFNFEWTNQSLFHNQYVRTDSFWENSDLQASGVAKGRELEILQSLGDLIPPSVLTDPAYVPRISRDDKSSDRGALRKAAQLLEEAGWVIGKSGMRENADGERLKIEFLNDGGSFERIIAPYIDNLKRLGIEAISDRVDSAQAQIREKNFDFDIVTSRMSMSLTPGAELRQYFSSQSADALGSANLSGIKDPAVDKLIGMIENAKTREDLDASVKALDRLLRALHIWVPQWHKAVHNIAYFDVFSRPYTDNPPKTSLGSMSIWWYDTEKAAKLRASGAIK